MGLYNQRIAELREKGLEIRDLIERAKTEADDGLHDILDKWQQANDKILEKYPEGHKMSQEQLEEVARNSIEILSVNSEEHKLRGKGQKKSTMKVGDDEDVPTLILPEDDAVILLPEGDI